MDSLAAARFRLFGMARGVGVGAAAREISRARRGAVMDMPPVVLVASVPAVQSHGLKIEGGPEILCRDVCEDPATDIFVEDAGALRRHPLFAA